MNNKVFFIVLLFFLNFFTANGNGTIKMVFRYDDYTLVPSQFNDSIINIFQKNCIPLCLGIVPYDAANLFINKLNTEQINDLRSRIQRKEIEVALHGYNHSNNIEPSFLVRTTYSEFATVNYDLQYEKIAKGKNALDTLLHINTNIFIPPFNTYDKNTLKALEALNFEIISASMSGVTSGNKIKYIPATFQDFTELISIINNSKSDDVIIIFYLHQYSFKEGTSIYSNNLYKLISVSQLDSLLHWINEQNVSFYTFSDLAKTGNFDKAIFRANSTDHNLFKKILNKIKSYRYGIYSTSKNQIEQLSLLFGNFVIHLMSFVLVYLFIAAFIKILRPGRGVALVFLAFLTVLFFIYLYYSRFDHSFFMKFTILVLNFTAILLGILGIFLPPLQFSVKKFKRKKL